MKRIHLGNGTVRAIITFVLVFASLQLFFVLLRSNFDIDFFADILLSFIGAGWLAYYVWRKTEVGYY